jgi:phage tail-like protein
MTVTDRLDATATSALVALKVEGLALGTWTSLDGLSMEFEVTEWAEGGENDYVHKLPGRAKHGVLKFSRGLDGDSSKVAQWLAAFKSRPRRTTATVIAYDANGKKVVQWDFDGVWPLRWTGPSFAADKAEVAKETLELAHEGFRAS